MDKAFLSFALRCLKPEREFSRKVARKLKGYPRKSVIALDDLPQNAQEFGNFGFHAIHYTGDNKKMITDFLKLGVEV